MITPTREYLEEIIKGTCPECVKNPSSLKFRSETSEWIHHAQNLGNHSFRICMATHLRLKYKDVLNG